MIMSLEPPAWMAVGAGLMMLTTPKRSTTRLSETASVTGPELPVMTAMTITPSEVSADQRCSEQPTQAAAHGVLKSPQIDVRQWNGPAASCACAKKSISGGGDRKSKV